MTLKILFMICGTKKIPFFLVLNVYFVHKLSDQ